MNTWQGGDGGFLLRACAPHNRLPFVNKAPAITGDPVLPCQVAQVRSGGSFVLGKRLLPERYYQRAVNVGN